MTVENISIDVKTNAGSAAQQFRSLSSALSGVQGAGKKATSGFAGVGNSAKRSVKHTNEFASSLMRIAKYRMLRTILKEIGKAFNEGLKNAYNFSKSIDGTLASAMDTLAVKSLTMKNQLGAMFGNLLQIIMPIILKIVELIRMAAQAISALFSALGGGDYLIATDVATSWDKATGAAKKYKNTILGFDEINRLNDETGGGGGSSADFTKMFEKGELPAWAKWIADHMKLIKDLAIAVGVAIAAWNFAKAISGLLGVESGFSQLLGIAIAAGGAVLMISGYIDAIKNGLNWENLLKILSGATLIVTGLALAFGKTGAAVGFLVSGISLLSIGIVDWLKKGELTQQSFASIEVGILAVGVAISLLTGSWIPLLISVIGGLVFAATGGYKQVMGIISNLKEKLKGLIESTEEYFGNGKLEWQDFAFVAAKAILVIVNAIEKLITTIKNVIDWIGRFNTEYQGVKSRLNDIEGHKETYGSVWGEVVRGAEIGAWASGGMPETGSLFIAGEAGAEIVTNMGNGRTGVTNVEQMEAAVANGNTNVVNAVYAMANMIVKAVNDIDPDIQLDGQSLADKMYHYNKQAANRYGAALVT